MFEIKDDCNYYFNITAMQEWDSNMNNHSGGYKMVAQILPGQQLLSVDGRLSDLEQKFIALITKIDLEEKMRDEHPAIKDAWEQYQVTLRLATKVKDDASTT